jgi:hypothetical protein
MVASDVHASELAPRGCERHHLLLAHVHCSVGEIADMADDIGVELVDAVCHRRGPPGAVNRSEVGVSDHRHAGKRRGVVAAGPKTSTLLCPPHFNTFAYPIH